MGSLQIAVNLITAAHSCNLQRNARIMRAALQYIYGPLSGRGGGVSPFYVEPYLDFRPSNGDETNDLIPHTGNGSSTYPNNLLRYAKGQSFVNVAGNGCTITKNAANDPDGNPTAIRAQSTNTTGITQITGIYLPAGTYTLSQEARSHDQSSSYNTFFGVSLSNQFDLVEITGSYQTFSKTFTVGTPGSIVLYLAYRNTTGDAYDINADNFRIHEGSSDLGADAGSKNLLFGVNKYANATYFTGNEFRSKAAVILPDTKSLTEFTCLAAFNQAGAGGGTVQPMLGSDSYTEFSIGSQSDKLATRVGGQQYLPPYGIVRGLGWLIVTCRVKDGQVDQFVNRVLVRKDAPSFSGFDTDFFFHGQLGGTTVNSLLPSGDEVGAIQLFDSFLSEDQLNYAIEQMEARQAADGNTIATISYSLTACGDSITQTGSPLSYARQIFSERDPLVGDLVAIPSTGIAETTAILEARAGEIAMQAENGSAPIFSILTGANDDDVTNDPSGYYADLVAAYDVIRNAGGKVLAITILPKADASFNTGRATVNTLLRGDDTVYDALADIDTTSTGDDAEAFLTTYYSDGIHPTAAGHTDIKGEVDDALDAIIAAL